MTKEYNETASSCNFLSFRDSSLEDERSPASSRAYI